MKNILFFFISICLVFNLVAQTPESGWFWALEIKDDLYNDASGKHESMGWEKVASGKFAIKFEKDFVTLYSNGNMGKNYEKVEKYAVLERKKEAENDDFADYTYYTRLDNKLVLFEISVSIKSGYEAAVITILENIEDIAGKYIPKRKKIFRSIRTPYIDR